MKDRRLLYFTYCNLTFRQYNWLFFNNSQKCLCSSGSADRELILVLKNLKNIERKHRKRRISKIWHLFVTPLSDNVINKASVSSVFSKCFCMHSKQYSQACCCESSFSFTIESIKKACVDTFPLPQY